jgi:RNA polymerase sigma-70 factor (ECF subfamily)
VIDRVATAQGALAAALAAERLRIVAGLIRTTGDFDLAEDCLQDAAVRALDRWPTDGVPDNPAAWLTTAARRRALDVLRRRRTEADKLREVQAMRQPRDADPGEDDRLQLVFTCCHPALPLAGRVALTLKTVSGLSTRQVAAAFLTSEATMGQRLLRAKGKITHAGISFALPEPHRLAERTAGVLAVIYLVFNEGYSASTGPAHDPVLAREAVELAGLLAELMPYEPEVHALRALLLLQHSRRSARVDPAGDLVAMEEQDRRDWDHRMIGDGLRALQRSRDGSGVTVGPYRVQAEIAALHATAAEPASTDWAGIVTWYDALLTAQPSPVVALNRAVALGYRDGPAAGLLALDEVAEDPRLADYHLVPAVRADLLWRAGRPAEAATAYSTAHDLARTEAERRFLARRRTRAESVLDPDTV